MYQEKFSLKDQLFNVKKVVHVATEIANVYSDFDASGFIAFNVSAFPQLELKERIKCMACALGKFLPNDFEKSSKILLLSLPEPCNPELGDNDFGDFIYAPYGEFIVEYGCNANHVELSLEIIEQLTTRFSMEYAIRPFINAFPNETFNKLNMWAKHPHYHVRRLASEGSRPKLPWGKKITTPIENTFELLDTLHRDHTRFVTRSVANHLNDLSKIHSEIVFELLTRWQTEKLQNPDELSFITKHALRTLIKKGDSRALQMIGFGTNAKLNIEIKKFTESVKMNEFLEFEILVSSSDNCSLLIDYIIHFQNKKGQMNSAKVFKLKQIKAEKNVPITLLKKHEMKQSMSTRTIYPGLHKFVLQINGNQMIELDFQVKL